MSQTENKAVPPREAVQTVKVGRPMKVVLVGGGIVYVLGFVAFFAMHTQMPVTFGLAMERSAAWPVSVVTSEMWPRGAPTFSSDSE